MFRVHNLSNEHPTSLSTWLFLICLAIPMVILMITQSPLKWQSYLNGFIAINLCHITLFQFKLSHIPLSFSTQLTKSFSLLYQTPTLSSAHAAYHTSFFHFRHPPKQTLSHPTSSYQTSSSKMLSRICHTRQRARSYFSSIWYQPFSHSCHSSRSFRLRHGHRWCGLDTGCVGQKATQ